MSASVKVFLSDTGEIEQIIFLDKEDQSLSRVLKGNMACKSLCFTF